MSPDAAVARLAARQQGNVTYAQLRSAGLSERQIETRSRAGLLLARFHGVYGMPQVPDTWFSSVFAAWLACGRTSALSHLTCAGAFGVLPQHRGAVHLTRPTRGPHQDGLVLHHADLTGDVWEGRGLLLTSPARLMLDLAATHPHRVLERAYNEAQVRKLLTPADLQARVYGWSGRRGVRALRELLVDHGVTRSVLEDAFKALLREARLPAPEWNQWVDGVFVDAVWRAERVVVELDSRGYHSTDARFDSDRGKSNDLMLRGWTPLRFTHGHLTRRTAWVIATLTRALSGLSTAA